LSIKAHLTGHGVNLIDERVSADAASWAVAPAVRVDDDPTCGAPGLPLHFVVLGSPDQPVTQEGEVPKRCAGLKNGLMRLRRSVDRKAVAACGADPGWKYGGEDQRKGGERGEHSSEFDPHVVLLRVSDLGWGAHRS